MVDQIEYFEEKELIFKNILSIDKYNSNFDFKILLNIYDLFMNQDRNFDIIFKYIMDQILLITKSDIGAITEKDIEKNDSEQDEEYLKFLFISKIINSSHSKKFHSAELDNLLGRATNINKIVISNNVSKDPRSKGVPPNHFKLQKFVGIPLMYHEICIGEIVLANKTSNYTEEDIYAIYPLINITTNIINHIQYNKKYSIQDVLNNKSEVQKTKDDFIATMSHEIRTPLTGIMGSLQLLPQFGDLNEKQMKHLKIANTCAIQLLDLINGILDFSRLNSNTLILTKEPFNIKNIITDSLTIIRPKLDAKGLELKLSIDKNMPDIIIGDSKRLKQILINILSNAIKFTSKGYIEFICLAKKNENNWKLKFIIKDTGIGIEPIDQAKLFRAFSQITGKNAYNKEDGAGLGLVITKQLVELMNGKIKIFSDGSNKGTTVDLHIILEENINIDSILIQNKSILENINILCIDDNIENLLILDEMLSKWNIKNIITSNSAEQGLRYLERGKLFDIIMIDIYMPHMSGIELAQKLRKEYKNIPLIGISSVGNIQGQEWFDIYLSKPYEPLKILRSIIKCITQPKLMNVLHKSDTRKIITKENFNIIVAEDDENTQAMVSDMFDVLGYKNVKLVSNGKECVDEIKKKLETTEKYDICFMDIKMPVMDGIEASKNIKVLDNKPTLIAMSAGVLDSDKNNYLAAGMDGYLGKPFTIKNLEDILNRFIGK